MHGCQHCILHVRRNNSRKIWCWGKKFTVLSLLNFNQIMFVVFAEKFQHGGQTCISHLQMILPRKKNNSLEKHIIFHTVLRIWASKLRSLVWKFHARLSKLHSTCTKEQFEKNLMLGKKVYCFITFEFQSKYVQSFCRKISARWSKLHFTSRDDHSQKEQISRIKQKFWVFWDFERPIYGVWWKLHARLSKLNSTCTKEQFEKKLVLGKNLNCFLITFEI